MKIFNGKEFFMGKEFYQCGWDLFVERDLLRLSSIAVDEDVSDIGDLTSLALIPDDGVGGVSVVVREDVVVAGLMAIPVMFRAIDEDLFWEAESKDEIYDGKFAVKGKRIGRVAGSVRAVLQAERLLLNLVGRLMGIATLTRKYVDAISGTAAKIYDTRKTTLGWRRLEKYAVRCGGGQNHRTGLFDAILIKDNHLAFGKEKTIYNPAEAVCKAKEYLKSRFGQETADTKIVEVEVDNLDQLSQVLQVKPDIVLLDNMSPEILRQAVMMRNNADVAIELEASGGVRLSTVKAVAATGVERISVGALTHSATSIDIGLDWTE
ncbi:MAG: carboxylating nicotinate-nucleotide diphosphorylase [Planctomycetaceae bacterium]|jgi:nicotinate-nucleotide pyrophosphorylase (carboxylating)|nr:carboxylating nicotinate-nucleotide diphosphorylase [Planctomycetaceae bacterium]